MPTKKSPASWPVFSLLALLAALHASPALASGGGDDCDDLECDSFFAPEVIQNPAESPFFRSDRTFYQHAYDVDADPLHSTSAVNAREWFVYFDGQLKGGTLEWLLYKMPLQDLTNLRTVIEGKDVPLSDKAKTLLRLFNAYGKKAKVLSALRYLELAKQIEPMANRRSGDGAWDPSEQEKHRGEDRATADRLLALAPGLIKGSDAFIAERVRLQVIRLYFYTAQYGAAESYFESELPKFRTGTSARWRFLETAAGAFYKDKKFGRANYLYSLVYGLFPSEKKNAYFSFHPVEETDWQQTLSLAKGKREKTVLWQLLGVYADGLAAIDQITALDPRSDLLPLLLVREVNKAEESWTSNRNLIDYSSDDSSVKPKSDAEAVGVERLARLRAIADGGAVDRPWLWRLSVGHLLALAGDYAAASHYLVASANGMPNDPLIRGQLRASLLLNRVLALRAVDRSQEDVLAKELTWLSSYASEKNFRAATLKTFLLADLAKLYTASGDVTRGLMLTDSAASDAYRDVAKLNTILSFRTRASSAFDRFLVKNYQYNEGQLRHLQALASLYRGEFTAARAFLHLAGAKFEQKPLIADPFTDRINDCHECDQGDEHTVMTLAAFMDRMIALSEAARGTGEEAAKASLTLGNGLYNMSFYGNGRYAYDTDHGNFTPPGWYDEKRHDAEPTMNMDLAERAYIRAASLSASKELRARATFLAAKAEQNRWYNVHPQGDGKDIHPGKHYEELKSQFSDTQYFQEVIKECGYFRAWNK